MLQIVAVSLVIGLVTSVLANLSTTVYLHRALAHRALTLGPLAAFAFRVGVWLTTGIRRQQWVAVHRKHHAFTDVPGDPHSPVLLGWVRVQLTNVALYRRAAKHPETIERYGKDLPPDRWDQALFNHALPGLTLGILFLVVVFGWQIGLLAAFVHLNLYLAGSAAVNAMGHHFGRRPYPNSAGNLQWLAFLTAGEGLHNNHHAAPANARLSHRWFEIDYGWWVIAVLEMLGLAKVRLAEVKVVDRRSRSRAA